MSETPRARYAAAGVDVDAGEALVERIKPLAAATARPGLSGAIGGFGGLFDLSAAGHDGSLLVASADGVGTKLRLAIDLSLHRGVGVDLVAMCANDVLAQGAEPLFFLDYFATGKLEVDVASDVVAGIAEGCREAGCALLGGETAEMPGHYAGGDYDLAGFVLGAVARDRLLPRDVPAGAVLVALASSGLHSNGYSLVRRIATERGWDFGRSFGETTLGAALMAPTRIYVRPVLAALERFGDGIFGIAHITGGGLTGNVPRMLPEGRVARIERGRLFRHPMMDFVQQEGGLSDAQMEATFNCGAGLVLAVAREVADGVAAHLEAAGERAAILGEVCACDGPPSCEIE
jgi:phosphoribosylformylglycinamidine cyclo-ligase